MGRLSYCSYWVYMVRALGLEPRTNLQKGYGYRSSTRIANVSRMSSFIAKKLDKKT